LKSSAIEKLEEMQEMEHMWASHGDHVSNGQQCTMGNTIPPFPPRKKEKRKEKVCISCIFSL